MKRIRHYNRLIVELHAHFFALAVLTVSAALLWLQPSLEYRLAAAWPERAWLALAGQLTHLDPPHLLYNAIGLLAISWGFEPWRTRWRDTLFAASGVTGVWLGLMLSDQVLWYRGLSGALHGLFSAYALWVLLSDRRRATRFVCVILLAGLGIKLWLETGWAASTEDAARPVLYVAHQWGAMAGVVIGAIAGVSTQAATAWAVRHQKKQPTTRPG